MTEWLTTEQAAAYLKVGVGWMREMFLAPVSDEADAGTCYAGTPGTGTGRYRWRLDRLDRWFEEAAEWRLSQREAGGSASGGATRAAEGPRPTRSPSAPAGGPRRSPRRSSARSSETASMSLAEHLARLRSE